MARDNQWYKDAIIYEVHVRAFFDTNSDGRGDFQGLTQKLDYLVELGVTALWLLPFYPSPWRDDGYDISNYTEVHPAYGTLRDFQFLVREAHRRGLAVITELVLNHTSDQHPWFQRSRRAKPGTRWRDFYVWSDRPDKYKEARIIFKDFLTSNWSWDPEANAYYWHRFFSHQPDLNFDNPLVRRAMVRIVDFWLDQGVDGFRLDAIPYLIEREGTNCENLPETHAYLKELCAHIRAKRPDCLLLAEANMWPEDAVPYFGAGDECNMSFHFPLMPRLFTAIQMEDRFPIVEILRQTPSIPDNCQWALFLRNHDELTLEMVTDEERDYMYRTYALDPQMRINLGIRRRLAPLLGNDRRRIELMNALLFSLPGTPVIYYGDEIGMGDNVYMGDRDSVRTPMHWNADRNAGFSLANPQRLYLPINIDPEYHYESINVENQQRNTHSLLWSTRRMTAIRRRMRVFGRGSLEFLQPDNRKVLAFHRQFEDASVIVIANLSRFAQAATFDLSRFDSMTPLEVFGRTAFPVITTQPYVVTIGPYAFYWLALEQRRKSVESINSSGPAVENPPLEVASLDEVFDQTGLDALTRALSGFLQTRRWFQGRGRTIDAIRCTDVIRLRPTASNILIMRVDYAEGDPETYAILATVATGERAEQARISLPESALQVRDAAGRTGVLYSSIHDPEFASALFEAMGRRRRFRCPSGELAGTRFRSFEDLHKSDTPPKVQTGGSANNTIAFGEQAVLKVYRRLEPGVSPEPEMGIFLANHGFQHIAPVAGIIEYRANHAESTVLGVLNKFVPHEATAWDYTLDSLAAFFEKTKMKENDAIAGSYLEMVRLLGQRTGEFHLTLCSSRLDPAFAPELYTDFYRIGLYHGLLAQITRSFMALRELGTGVPFALSRLGELEESLRATIKPFRGRRFQTLKIRQHGHYHLGQVLFTGKDFVIIDLEGDPRRRLNERRAKRCALRDVASMLYSFRFASIAATFGLVPGVQPHEEDRASIEKWGAYWYEKVSDAFLKGYLATVSASGLLPPTEEEVHYLLQVLKIEEGLTRVEHHVREQERKLLAVALRMLQETVSLNR